MNCNSCVIPLGVRIATTDQEAEADRGGSGKTQYLCNWHHTTVQILTRYYYSCLDPSSTSLIVGQCLFSLVHAALVVFAYLFIFFVIIDLLYL